VKKKKDGQVEKKKVIKKEKEREGAQRKTFRKGLRLLKKRKEGGEGKSGDLAKGKCPG